MCIRDRPSHAPIAGSTNLAGSLPVPDSASDAQRVAAGAVPALAQQIARAQSVGLSAPNVTVPLPHMIALQEQVQSLQQRLEQQYEQQQQQQRQMAELQRQLWMERQRHPAQTQSPGGRVLNPRSDSLPKPG